MTILKVTIPKKLQGFVDDMIKSGKVKDEVDVVLKALDFMIKREKIKTAQSGK